VIQDVEQAEATMSLVSDLLALTPASKEGPVGVVLPVAQELALEERPEPLDRVQIRAEWREDDNFGAGRFDQLTCSDALARTVPASVSTSFGLSASASLMRRPVR